MKLGLGTAALGRPEYINVRHHVKPSITLDHFKTNGFSVLDQAYKLGIRYFDTAPGYGLAEELLIEWLQTKKDPNIEIATKWGYTYVANFDPKATVHEIKEHSIFKLNEQWKVSKTLLPHLKIYQIHSATIETGVLENRAILERLATLKKDYNLKIGITTTGDNQVDVIKKAIAVLVDKTPLFDVFQSTYNILDQSILEIASKLIKQGKQFVLKETLANGRLLPNSNFTHYKKLYTTLKNLSAKYNVGIDAIALQFCMQTLPDAITLIGVSNTMHLEQNLKATTFSLSKQDIDELVNFKIKPYNYWQERKQLPWN